MVGVARIELATPAMSTQCSTTELHAHTFRGDAPLKGLHAGWQAPRATKCDYCWCDRSALSNNASTSRTRSLRWKGLDSSFACGTFSSEIGRAHLNSSHNAHLVCRLLLEKKQTI